MEATKHEVIFDYYLNFIPFIINLMSPLFTFIAVIFFTSKMASRYETVAILSSGISYARFLRPYMIGATMIFLFSLYSSHFLLPKANFIRQAFEDKYMNNMYQTKENNIHRQIAKGTNIYIKDYYNHNNSANNFTIEKIVDYKQVYFLQAENIMWDSIKHEWIINNYYEKFLNVKKTGTNRDSMIFGATKRMVMEFTPKDMQRIDSKVDVMTYPELKKFIAKEREKGANGIERFEVENYKRTSLPFATFILTLIGVSISSRKMRGGIGIHIAIGLLLAATYILFLHVSSIFAVNGVIPSPLFAVWLPNIVYSFIAAYLLKTAQK